MATRAPKAVVIPTPKLVEDALALAARFRDAEGLSRHAVQRKPLLQGASAALGLLGLGCGAGVFLFFAGLSNWTALPGVLLAPLAAACSLAVIFYVFFSWIEARALAQALGHRTSQASFVETWLRKRLRADLMARPQVPWLAAALFVGLPFALLALAAPIAAVVLLLVGIATPVVYARLDAA
ncbi:MAG: hypothetical protein ACT4P3_05830 [Betaproteobacteria bacterium]